jgi:hypothetical protein
MVCNLFQTAKLKWIGAGLGAGASRAGAGWVGVEVFCKKKHWCGSDVIVLVGWCGCDAVLPPF